MSTPAREVGQTVAQSEESKRNASAEMLIESLKHHYRDRITGDLVIPARPGDYAPLPSELEPRLVTALRARGIERLYSHQSRAWQCVHTPQHTVVVTPTASGKTLCYNLPVLQAAIKERTKALYLFPTKALSQDQVAEIIELNQPCGHLPACLRQR